MDYKTARQDLETVIRVEDLALGSMRKLRGIQDWLRWKASCTERPASGEVCRCIGPGNGCDCEKCDDTHPPAKVPEVLALCEQCHKEFSVPLSRGGNTSPHLLCNFCNCPHCNTRNDLWIKLTTPTPATTPEAEWVKVPEVSDFAKATASQLRELANSLSRGYHVEPSDLEAIKVMDDAAKLLTTTSREGK